MATVKAVVRRAFQTILGKGAAAYLTAVGARTIELAASASGTVVDFNLRVPTNARIDMSSRIYFDDLATSGSPTMQLGFYGVDGNTATSMVSALATSLTISSASATNAPIQVPADYADAGKRLWEVAGLATDPGGFFDVKGVVKSAATTTTGTITLDMKLYDS